MMGIMPTTVHFDLPADDIGRAQAFYGSRVGWTLEKDCSPIEYYQIATTAPEDAPGVTGCIGPLRSPYFVSAGMNSYGCAGSNLSAAFPA
jgi:predicted enzyme related to lactoylglutathione lyase